MRFDLRSPCKNCPFRTDATAIRFACLERAEEISESAYRFGFPCHLSADHEEDDDGESGGYVFGANTQHCAGALIMFARHDDGTIPFARLTEKRQDHITERLDWDAPVFEDERAFLESYEDGSELPGEVQAGEDGATRPNQNPSPSIDRGRG